MRCIKTKMKDLQIGVDGQNYYKPDSFMGHPNILFIENGWLCSKLFAVEQVFKSKRDCLLDINNPSPIKFEFFYTDIFGDG